jgi:hypothetical protein
MEPPGITWVVVAWVVVAVKAFSALYPKGSDDVGLGVTGVPIASWLTTVLLVGIVGMCRTMVEWAIWRGRVDLGPTDGMFGPTGDVAVKVVVPVKWFRGMV